MRRSDIRWRRWDEAVAAGERPRDFLPRLSDEALVELLGGAERNSRLYEWALVAEELLARLTRLREALGDVAQAADHYIGSAIDDAEEATRRIQQSVDSVENHLRVRNDEVDGEPQTVKAAGDAAKRVRASLDRAGRTSDDLKSLAAETRARGERD